MQVKNKITGKVEDVTLEQWNALGNLQNRFKVVNETAIVLSAKSLAPAPPEVIELLYKQAGTAKKRKPKTQQTEE